MTLYNPQDDNPIIETDRLPMHATNPDRSTLDSDTAGYTRSPGRRSGWTLKTLFDYLGTNLWQTAPAATAMTWHDKWVQQEYNAGSVVVDGLYLMIANKVTSDRAAPQEEGVAAWLVPDAPTWATNSPSVTLVETGAEFTMTENALLVGVRVWVPKLGANILYRAIARDITDPAAVIVVRDETIAPVGTGWHVINSAGYTLVDGSTYLISLQASDNTSSGQFSGPWSYSSGNGNVVPGFGAMYQRNNGFILRVNQFDDDLVDRLADLDTILVGTNLTFANGAVRQVTTINPKVGDVYEFGISNVSGTPANALQTVTFDVPVVQATDYVVEAAAAVGNSEGIISIDGAPATKNTDLYGVDIRIQPVVSSPDWDIMAITSVN